jgi:hypothetical protein
VVRVLILIGQDNEKPAAADCKQANPLALNGIACDILLFKLWFSFSKKNFFKNRIND